jgi:hypothetical protein
LVLVTMMFVRESGLAQGTVQFVWHGSSNLFQASFQVTQAEMSGSSLSGSSVFVDSISVTSRLSGVTYRYDVAQFDQVAGTVNPWSFFVIFYDSQQSTQLQMSGGEPPVGAMAGGFVEHPYLSSQTFNYSEGGYWSYSIVPEPSAIALVVLGAVVFVVCKRRGRFITAPSLRP